MRFACIYIAAIQKKLTEQAGIASDIMPYNNGSKFSSFMLLDPLTRTIEFSIGASFSALAAS